ncbi:zonular occludens toxin domain-containing protein [Arcobacter sp. YIC-464]|uniref:zonular occludens toxin domain-containing protein n=1 Tax=Arcobacter sp. YIC-464 TaxID=3376631 RepID=UPI003C184E91
MVVFGTGVMGAGKSYEAICRIYAYFGKDSKTKTYLKSKFIINKDIKYLRTNIPYNKDSFTIEKDTDTSFKFEKFYEKILLLHAYYLDDNVSEKELVNHAKDFGIADTFFVIDECHNYLDKADKALLFFFTYHRHFHCEVLLITQNLSLVNYKYKGFCEQFVRAVPSTFQLVSRNFVYKYFPSSRMSAKELYKTEKIKKLDIVFKAYTSGGKVFTNNAIKKILISSAALLALVITAFYFLVSNMTPQQETPNINEVNSTPVNVPTQNNSTLQDTSLQTIKEEKLFDITDFEGFILIKLVCNKTKCFNSDFSMSSKLLEVLYKKKILEVISFTPITKSSYSTTVATKPAFINLFQYKGVNDEKDINVTDDTKYTYSSK